MKALICAGAIIVVGLAYRERPRAVGESNVAHGRYVGVGIYQAGSMWSQMVVANTSKDQPRGHDQR